MKIKSKFIPIVLLVILAVTGSMFIYGGNRQSDDTEQESPKEILTDNNVIDAGDHIVVYRTDLQKKDRYFKGEYLVLRDLDADRTVYLPDIYGEILEICVEDLSKVYIRYRISQDEPIQEITIPLCFEGKEGNGLNLDLSMKGKVATQLQGDTGSLVQDLPLKIWSEDIRWDGKSYEVLFERTSPIYEPVGGVTGGFFADYCLTVQDGEGNAISHQTIADYPVAYEEMYWLIDYSQDGFPDIVFCTDHYQGKNSYTRLHFLHWNTERNLYEPDPLVGPGGRYMGISYDVYLWNPILSAVVLFSGGDEWGNLPSGALRRSFMKEMRPWRKT